MKAKIYIDGKDGTTGLQIYDRLLGRDDIELLIIDEALRKDPSERRKMMASADLCFFCLPDAAAVEAAALCEDLSCKVIDASTAHRTAEGWVYGFPELFKSQREKIKSARLVANPGCHASGFLALAAPLVQLGILPKDYPVTCFSLTGYSGGGKKMISQYETEKTDELFAPRVYGLNMNHKHVPEMQLLAGLTNAPAFSPVVDDYYKGMATSIQLHNVLLAKNPSAKDVCEALEEFYAGEKLISVHPFGTNPATLSANALAGKDSMEIFVCGDENLTIVTSRFDNLGKGASGAAVQNMNLMLGFEETSGLSL